MAGLQARLSDLLAGGLQEQLASILLREGTDSVSVKLTHNQLAELVGAPRSSAQRVLKSLEASGLIELHYRRIDVVDGTDLAALAS
jgi:CRP/FNR family transcriptional regulator